MADHVLAEGLAAATLRSLAAASGTSDRMLLYYFADKEELLTATLARIASRMIALLDAAVPLDKAGPFSCVLVEVWAAMASEKLRPFMALWLDVAARAARGAQPHRDIAGSIADGFSDWVIKRLVPGGTAESPAGAALFLALIEGMYLLKAIGREGLATSALFEVALP